MEEVDKNTAIIRISQKVLLEWLQFEGGVIHQAYIKPETLNEDINLVIEHPDLPLVKYQGEYLGRNHSGIFKNGRQRRQYNQN